MYNKTIIEFGFRMISWIIKPTCLCYLPQPSASADNTDLGFDNSWYHAQPHPIIVYYVLLNWFLICINKHMRVIIVQQEKELYEVGKIITGVANAASKDVWKNPDLNL